jgi:hypothetical protein
MDCEFLYGQVNIFLESSYKGYKKDNFQSGLGEKWIASLHKNDLLQN